MIMCQSRPLELSRTVRVLLADRPQFRHSEHSERQRLWTIFSTNKWTVRTPVADRPPFILKTHQRPNTSLVKKRNSLRTVRAPRADRPQAHQRLCKLSGTVADCPPLVCGLSAVTQSALNLSCIPKLININSNSFSFANVPTPPHEQHHVHVC